MRWPSIREWWDEVIWPLVSAIVVVVALSGLVFGGYVVGVEHEARRGAEQLSVDARGWPEWRLVLEMRGCEGGKRYFREVKGAELAGSSRAPEARR